MKPLKCLVLDIELAPMEVFVWQLKDQYVNVKQIKEDWSVLAWSAKWLGDPSNKLIYRSQEKAKDKRNDRKLVADLWRLLDEADIVLHQNGERFDCPKLNARFIIHGMRPPKPYRQIDTFKIARKVAAFTSNSLEYLTGKLNKRYKKLTNRKFSGLYLWKACLAGDRRAWAEMRKYNIYDVLSTEELYGNLRAWAPESTPTAFRPADVSAACRTCGPKGQMQRRGFAVKTRYRYQRWQCQTCGGWATGDKVADKD